MPRPSKLSPSDFPAATMDWPGLLARLRCAVPVEDSAFDQLRLQIVAGTLHMLLDAPPVTGHAFQFSLGPAGIVDLLLTHDDGQFTLVEAKGEVTVREACAGIGQLFAYEVGLRARLAREGIHQPVIRKVLCAALEPGRFALVSDACGLAGIQLVALVSAETVRKLTQEVPDGA